MYQECRALSSYTGTTLRDIQFSKVQKYSTIFEMQVTERKLRSNVGTYYSAYMLDNLC